MIAVCKSTAFCVGKIRVACWNPVGFVYVYHDVKAILHRQSKGKYHMRRHFKFCMTLAIKDKQIREWHDLL